MYRIVSDLTGLIAYNLFDMSYEGDYMGHLEDPEKDAEEMQAAVRAVNSWPYPTKDQWIRLEMLSYKL